MRRSAILILSAAWAATVLPGGPAAAQEPACPGADPQSAALVGDVLDGTGELSLPGATVVVRWDAGQGRRAGVQRATSDALGSFVVCGLPAGVPFIAEAEFAGRRSPGAALRLEPGETARRDFRVPLTGGAGARLGAVAGRVVDAETLAPVEAASVGLAGEEYTAVTDGSGRFRLTDVPAGGIALQVRHVAYGTQEAPVEVRADHTVIVEVQLAARPIALDPIQVEVVGLRELHLETRGFYERREIGERLGVGEFFTREDIERRNPQYLGPFIADVPGVRLDCTRTLGARNCLILSIRAPRSCNHMDVILDGIRVIRGDRAAPERGSELDSLVLPTEVAAVEVYPSASALPAEFGGASGQCGAVVIWTRAGR